MKLLDTARRRCTAALGLLAISYAQPLAAQSSTGFDGRYVLRLAADPKVDLTLIYGVSLAGYPLIAFGDRGPAQDQLFDVVAAGSGRYLLKDTVGGLCVEGSGTQATLATCSSTKPTQRLSFVVQESGAYRLSTDAGACLSAVGDSTYVTVGACASAAAWYILRPSEAVPTGPTTPPPTTPPPSASPCSAFPEYEVRVISPAYGAAVDQPGTLAVCARGMKRLWAHAWHAPDAAHAAASGYDAGFARAVPSADGYAELAFPAASYPRGPMTVLIDAWDAPEGAAFAHSDRAYLQLINGAGTSWSEGVPANAPANAGGKQLVYQDDFRGGLSISRTGAGATYASAKPDGPSGTEFGDAVFGSFGSAQDPFAIIGQQYLRIRAAKAPAGYSDPFGWGRSYIGGMISSVRTDGSGLAVSLGYFEVRMLAAHGKGGWPAFWLLSQNSLPKGAGGLATTAEVDVVELYTHDPAGACQSQHAWATSPEHHDTHCSTPFQFGDNAATWHVYAVNVTPTDTIYYIDQVEVWRRPTNEQAKTPLYFMIDHLVGGGWPADFSRYDGHIDLFVDYVRVYR